MAAGSIITGGFGPGGSIRLAVTLGFSISTAAPLVLEPRICVVGNQVPSRPVGDQIPSSVAGDQQPQRIIVNEECD